MEFLNKLTETSVDETNNNITTSPGSPGSSSTLKKDRGSRSVIGKLSGKLSASFYTPVSQASFSCAAVSFGNQGSCSANNKGSTVSDVVSQGGCEKKAGRYSLSTTSNHGSSKSEDTLYTPNYNIQITPTAGIHRRPLLVRRLTAPEGSSTPVFHTPPPPLSPPPSLDTPPSSTGSHSSLPTQPDSESTANDWHPDMDARNENLDVSLDSQGLAAGVSTDAIIRDLRKLNPTYSSDLSVNKAATLDGSLTSPRVSSGTKSPSSKRCSVNYPMASLSSPGSPSHGEIMRFNRSSRSSIDSGTSSGPLTKQSSGHFVVVAIDFGTTFSGYAFSFTQDPHSIHMMRKWEGGDPGLVNQKTPTCLLLEPDGNFHSFGFSARDFYHDLDASDAKKWLFFDKFKMVLHYHAELNHSTMLTAANGVKYPAKKVFSYSLQFFREHAVRELSDQSGVKMMTDDVKWVITVPAIWKQPAKQFMREAAYEAGLASSDNPDQLVIALEPEAASIYCRKLRMSQLVPDVPPPMPPLTLERNRKLLEVTEMHEEYVADQIATDAPHEAIEDVVKGSAYMVVDCGGGTVDITVHELAGTGGKLRELYRASGGPYGSVGVDNEFEQLLTDIFGSDFMESFKLKRPAGYVDLMIAFESRKRSASPYKEMPLNVSLPFSFIDFYKKYKGKTVETAIRKHGDPDIKWSAQGMLRLTQEAMRKLFVPTILKIKEAIGTVMVANSEAGIQFLFLVGGFAESPLLQLEIRREFSSMMRVIIPQDVGLSILKGAVLFGQDPTIIHVRISRMTYGVGVLNRFVKGKHPKHKQIRRDSIAWCTDVFDKFVLTDQPVTLGEVVIRSYTPAKLGQKYSVINIYSSERTDAMFITDAGVKKCGTLMLDLSELAAKLPSRRRREIQAKMEFGDTEIKVSAVDITTGATVKASIDFLSK